MEILNLEMLTLNMKMIVMKIILENINITIKAGETVGIIGSTGSGKTSLVQLIPRLYDVTRW